MLKKRVHRSFFWLFLLLVALPAALVTGQEGTDVINETAIFHDSRNDLFRMPAGAVPYETAVTLRLRTATGDFDDVTVRVYDLITQAQSLIPMAVVATTPEGHDLWEATVEAGSSGTILYYRFILRHGERTLYYEDDTINALGVYNEVLKGGAGRVYTVSPDASYQITVYDPEFYTPEWFRNGIIYQIFPDRFRDGDPSNNPEDSDEIFYGDYPLIFNDPWNSPMIDGRETLAPNGLGYWNSDFYGGDLAGITEQLDYLADLGITGIYLNPIFLARSNHRYDTVDFLEIDPMLGTLEDFQTLITEAGDRDIRIILDGVFNHMSSDSHKFDRYRRFPDVVGACESVNSDYRNWFYFREARGAESAMCDGEDGPVFYDSWFGYDSIPRINNTIFATRAYFIRGQDSVARTWGREGIGGWRLDVAGDIDDGRNPDNSYWESFRTVVRLENPEAVIIGEEWHDASPWLLGDEWDSTMNYRLRRGIIGFVRDTNFTDNDGMIPAVGPARFDAIIRSIEEDYPPPAYHAMMNLVGSHDNSRIFWVMNNNVDALKLVALTQYTLPGAPTIYYGDEIALDAPSKRDGDTYQDDPYNRAPYPWPDTEGNHYPLPNEDVLAFYQTLGQMRHESPALREGNMITLYADSAPGIYAFLRLQEAAGDIALVVLNSNTETQSAELNLDGIVPAGITLAPVLDGESITISSHELIEITMDGIHGNVWTATVDPALFTPHDAPIDITAESGNGTVTLQWSPVEGATGYAIYRSPVSTGGFEWINSIATEDSGTFITATDESVINGFLYHYAIASIGEGGIIGPQSPSVIAVPTQHIDAAGYPVTFAVERTITLAYGIAVDIEAIVTVEGATGGDDALPGVRAQAALIHQNPEQEPVSINWRPMTYAGSYNGSDLYTITLAPIQDGTYLLAARFSLDAESTWIDAHLDDGSQPVLIIEPAADSEAPPTPSDFVINRASISGVDLQWSAVEVDDLAAYRIYRSDQNDQTIVLAELPGDQTSYFDVAVTQGSRYTYAISAIDLALNESPLARTRAISVDRELLPITFLVNVPEGTDGSLYLAGDFDTAELPHWDPAGIEMEHVGDNQWAVTLDFAEGAALGYKFTRGSWETVEKGSACEEIENRRLSIGLDNLGERSEDGTFIVEHTIAKWRDLDRCP